MCSCLFLIDLCWRCQLSVCSFGTVKIYRVVINEEVGPVAQSVQRLATGWTVRGSNPGGIRIFGNCPDRSWGAPSLMYSGHWVFPGGKEWPGMTLIPHPLLVPWSRKGQSYTSTPPMGRRTCTEPQCLYRGALYLYLLLMRKRHNRLSHANRFFFITFVNQKFAT